MTGIAMPALLTDLYDEKPTRTLYHYTSLHGLQGIVESRSMWATEIRYLSDAKELVQTLEIFLSAIRIRYQTSDATKRELFQQLETWLRDRLVSGHLVFISSFTEEGNHLSQWRGYSPLGEGVSLGFDPQHLRKIAQEQAYQLGKCVYDYDLQRRVVQSILE
jgi:hypothetical protein